MNNWAPWIDDADDPADSYMTPEQNTLAARRAAGLLLDYDPDQPRAPKGAGNGGQWVKEGEEEGGGSWTKSGMTKESREKAMDDIQRDMSMAVHHEEDDQPTEDVDELIAMAQEAEQSFRKAIDKIASNVGGKPVYPPKSLVKGKERILEKAKLDYGGKVSEVKDMLRATIQTDTIEDARIAASVFIAEMGESVLRVKDKIISVERGYRDILINFRAENGVVSEVQFNATAMVREKFGEGHKLYEIVRANPDMDPAEAQKLIDKMNGIYDAAYDEAGDSKWMRSKGQ